MHDISACQTQKSLHAPLVALYDYDRTAELEDL